MQQLVDNLLGRTSCDLSADYLAIWQGNEPLRMHGVIQTLVCFSIQNRILVKTLLNQAFFAFAQDKFFFNHQLHG